MADASTPAEAPKIPISETIRWLISDPGYRAHEPLKSRGQHSLSITSAH